MYVGPTQGPDKIFLSRLEKFPRCGRNRRGADRPIPGGSRNWHNDFVFLSAVPMKKLVVKMFEARLERSDSPLNWVIIQIPFDVSKIWGTRGQLKVRGKINGFDFRSSLFPRRGEGHVLLVNKRMQRAAKAGPGMVAQFRLEPDTEKRIVRAPAELSRALAEESSLRQWFGTLSYSTKNEICKWIAQTKSAEARTRRAGQIAERLLATMEAERELPPILQIAFAQNPEARQGWERMSPSRRRGHFLGIFYYRSPEARAGRVNKAIEDAMEFADKAKSKGTHRRES